MGDTGLDDDATRELATESFSAPLTEAPTPTTPFLSGRFALTAAIGRGGMGIVYRAHDTMLDEDIALKILDDRVDPALLARLRQEVKLARRVTHPNVVRTFDMGMHGETPFITMELLDGQSLAALLARENGPLSLERFYPFAMAIASGVAAAHAASVLHLDLKPSNVLVGKDGRVAVTDFGVACLAGAAVSALGGTPGFMAPEQREGRTVDERADVYALGGIFFQLLTGTLPTHATPGSDGLLPPQASFIVLRCLAKEPEHRYPSAAEVVADLARLAPALDSKRKVAVSRAVAARSPLAPSTSRRATSDPVAFEHYTLGKLAYAKQWVEPLREAVSHFEAAIARCPEDPMLLATGALGHVRLLFSSGEPALARAQELLTRAVAVDREHGSVHLAGAVLAMSRGDEVSAVGSLQAALRRAPWLAEAHARLGEILGDIAELDRAFAELQVAYELEPLVEEPLYRRAQLLALRGDGDGADALFGSRPASEDNQNGYWWRRARAVLYAPTPARVARLRADLAPAEFQLRFVLDSVVDVLEHRELPAVLDSVLAQMATPCESPRRTWFYTLPYIDVLGFVGRTEDALDRLEQTDRHGLLDLAWLDRSPSIAGLRSAPRFAAVRAHVVARAKRVREAAVQAGLL